MREAVAAARLVELYATADAAAVWSDLLGSAREAGAGVHLVEPAALELLTATENPQGLVGVARWHQPTLASVLARRPELALMLHEVSDPGNLGAMVRVADAVAADFVALSRNSVDPTNSKCVRSSTGSVFHLPIVDSGDTMDAMAAIRAAGLTVLAADVTSDARDLFEVAQSGDLAGPTAWLFGNEAHGLPRELLARADTVVRIPILGRAESLNLATAGAVCLYTSVREQSRRAH